MPSISFSVNITLDTKPLDALAARIPSKAAELVERGARRFETVAKDNAPIDTGNLRSKIAADPITRVMWQVRDNTEYGIYQEFGVNHPYTINSPVNIKGHWVYIGTHPGFKAHPFWKPAEEATRKPYFNSFAELFSK